MARQSNVFPWLLTLPVVLALTACQGEAPRESVEETGSHSAALMTANITALTPAPGACLLRSSGVVAERRLTLTGTGFPFPRYSENLQFRREDTGEESIHFGMEVVWTSATQISVDIASISHLLWQTTPKVALQVRITTYDPSYPHGQRPISDWSDSQVVLANNATACQFANPLTRPMLNHYPLREPTRAVGPATMELFQFAMYNITVYTSTEGRHPGTDFLDLDSAGASRPGLQVAAAGDGTLLGYYDPAVSPMTAANQPAWVVNTSPTDTQNGRAFVVIAHGNVVAVYAHLAPGLRMHRAHGDRIHGGEVLGFVGTHGSGDHLHLETRTYGQLAYNLANAPLVFVNAWEFFNQSVRTSINQNINNRYQFNSTQAVAGWDSTYNGGTQRTQCFTRSGSQLSVYGYNGSGQHVSSVEDNSLPAAPTVVSGPTSISSWTTFCAP